MHSLDELFDECRGMTSLLANQLQWYTISDSDVESSDDDDAMSNGDDTSAFVDDADDGSDMSEPDHVARRFLHRMLFGSDDDDDVFMGDPYNAVEFGVAFSDDDDELASMSDDGNGANDRDSSSETPRSTSETPRSAS